MSEPELTDLIEEVQQEDAPPPPPPPQMERPPVEVPPPEVSIDIPMDIKPRYTVQTNQIQHLETPLRFPNER